MLLKKAIEEWSAFRFMIDEMELFAGNSRKELYKTTFSKNSIELEKCYDSIAYWLEQLNDSSKTESIEALTLLFNEVMDIEGSINHLKQRMLLDDIELFEIKQFGLLSLKINTILKRLGYELLPDLKESIDLLDPENQRLASFYIYDCYDKKLADIRKVLRSQKEEQEIELILQAQEIENKIRKELSEHLWSYDNALRKALKQIARIDIDLSKAKLALRFSCCKPEINNKEISYQGLYNPKLKISLEQQKKEIQPVDITINTTPILLTGINMGGKSVLLRTLALVQLLSQFGFYVPSRKANVVLVDTILCSMSDEQDETQGLSSFASEMKQIDHILSTIHKEKKSLILVDELARTTNPAEGRALVSSFLTILSSTENYCIVTSHYDSIEASCERLRVKGLRKEALLDTSNIEKWIDYTLVPDDSEHAPQEAIRIAQLLGINEEFIDMAKKIYLNQKK